MRSETRATLIAAIARGRRWLDELIADATATADSIAQRENCSVRKVNMTISLAFLAPDLVKATMPRSNHLAVAKLSGAMCGFGKKTAPASNFADLGAHVSLSPCGDADLREKHPKTTLLIRRQGVRDRSENRTYLDEGSQHLQC
jgi:hypothetical protein